MARKQQIIHLYCLCWNDARMLPYFFKHYDGIVDRYFILDNGSTDQSLELLSRHEKVEVTHFDVTGDSFVDEERRLSDTVWRRSKGEADWVLVIDIDEHVYRPDLRAYLKQCTQAGVTAMKAIGFEMVSDAFPTEDRPLSETIVTGVRSLGHDKLCFFDPDSVAETNFGVGRHEAEPTGKITWPEQHGVLLLHYKQLGVDYPIARSAELRRGLKSGDIEQRWGRHYTWSPAFIAKTWAELRAATGPVPGLGSLRHVPPNDYDEEAVIRRSGLFDAEWYLASNPDVALAETDPLAHFCAHGWNEGRKPNYYFDPEWYQLSYAKLGLGGANPLAHYVREGERNGAKPSVLFEPDWYREQYGLDETESPLAHYLARRTTGLVSPLPDFDVAAYCSARPGLLDEGIDPFEHSMADAEEPETPPETAEFPTFHDTVTALGLDPDAEDLMEVLDSTGALPLIRRFLLSVPVDTEWYLSTYGDVAEAVEEGVIQSARDHFIDAGYFEGRQPSPDAGEIEEEEIVEQ